MACYIEEYQLSGSTLLLNNGELCRRTSTFWINVLVKQWEILLENVDFQDRVADLWSCSGAPVADIPSQCCLDVWVMYVC
jgi:hypothetical protein